MSNERRIAPRKIFSIPIRIRSVVSESVMATAGANARTKSVITTGPVQKSVAVGPAKVVDMLDGETVNLSERGVYFKSAQKAKNRAIG